MHPSPNSEQKLFYTPIWTGRQQIVQMYPSPNSEQKLSAAMVPPIMKVGADAPIAKQRIETQFVAQAGEGLREVQMHPSPNSEQKLASLNLDRPTLIVQMHPQPNSEQKHFGLPCCSADLVTGRRIRGAASLARPLPIKRIHDRWIGEYARDAVDLLDELGDH